MLIRIEKVQKGAGTNNLIIENGYNGSIAPFIP